MAKRKSFLLRLDPKLWDELNIWAQSELRSVNGQIEFLLREAIKKRKKSFTSRPDEKIKEWKKED